MTLKFARPPLQMVLALSLIAVTFFGASPPALAAFSDGEISQILKSTNDVNVAAGNYAFKQASQPTVKAFAKGLITRQEKLQKEILRWAESAKVKLAGSEKSKSLKDQAEIELLLLSKSKSDFDKDYLSFQVKQDEQMLKTFDEELIPGAQHKALKKILNQARNNLQNRLERAKKIQAQL